MSGEIVCLFAADLKRARDHFGDTAQQLKCAEECSELAAATLRAAVASQSNWAQMVEETADVLITAMGNREILGVGLVDAEIRRKLARLNQRIDEAESQPPKAASEPTCKLCRDKGYVVTYWPFVDGKQVHDEAGVQVECHCKKAWGAAEVTEEEHF